MPCYNYVHSSLNIKEVHQDFDGRLQLIQADIKVGSDSSAYSVAELAGNHPQVIVRDKSITAA